MMRARYVEVWLQPRTREDGASNIRRAVVTVPLEVSSLTVPTPPQCGHGNRCLVLSGMWWRRRLV